MKNPVNKPKWWDEFLAFAVKGNAMALAVGTIIGAAFSGITKSLTDDVIMPQFSRIPTAVGTKRMGRMEMRNPAASFTCSSLTTPRHSAANSSARP